ncbi:ATP-grasp fold amidoligase family protein [Allobacillus sp. GCM10007491]|uniref:Glycosyl transferase n=1 Tax=Allobacillus saliphilus TaxID=2912308 RepID=A0A941CRI2_9BACI|nr:ATP-grasp fold amidoligase family protein [Allobacillus saliphilus]MBR7552553.1 glycosyl transferase [Allobacillus saliphilus]
MKTILKKLFNESEIIIYLYDRITGAYFKNFISDERLIRKKFKNRLGRDLQLDNPVKFNDKLQWLKLNWYDPLATKCADKYEVREFVSETIGEEYLNELYGVYESVDEIDIDKLPNSFVLKGTHGSGYNVICKDKNKMNWDEEFKKMRRWLRLNYFWKVRQWVYKDIKPRIVCEKFIEQEEGAELRDYRFFCFNGNPKFITVDFSITNKKNTRRNLYDLDWNLMEQEIAYPRELNLKVDKPDKLDKMIELSKKLSANFPHARVDFYYIDNRIIFGEITFFHQGGMGKIKPLEFEDEMGSWLKLPKKPAITDTSNGRNL